MPGRKPRLAPMPGRKSLLARRGSAGVARAPFFLLTVALFAVLSGCLANEFLAPIDETARTFSCAVLSDGDYPALLVRVEKDPAVRYSVAGPVGHLREVVANHSEKALEAIELEIRVGFVPPEGGWTEEALADQAERHSFKAGRNVVVLTIWWTEGPLGAGTGTVLAPGLVVLAQDAITAKAAATGFPGEGVARAVLLHHVGHALGQVNDGIPMQQDHEGSAKHGSDITSVMHPTWHDAGPFPEPLAAPPEEYPAAVAVDWAAARAEGGVCA